MSSKNDKKYQYNIKIKSKIHNDIYHTVHIDLYCYEKMPSENKINGLNKKCYNNHGKRSKREGEKSI